MKVHPSLTLHCFICDNLDVSVKQYALTNLRFQNCCPIPCRKVDVPI